MAKTLAAQKSYTLEKTGDQEVTMHFPLNAPAGPNPVFWSSLLLVLAVCFGIAPAALIGMAFTAATGVDAFTNGVFPVALWVLMLAGSAYLVFRSIKSRKVHKVSRGRLVFTPSSIESARQQVLARADITESYWQGKDITFSYKSSSEYNFKKANADARAERTNTLFVKYGADKIPLTYPALMENQAQDMADAVTRWIGNPESLFNEADTAAQAA